MRHTNSLSHALLLLVLFAAGCSQEFHVEVQRIKPAGGITDTTVMLDPARVDAVTRSAAAMRDYVALKQKIQAVTDRAVTSSTASNGQQDATTAVARSLRSASEVNGRADELVAEGDKLMRDMSELPAAFNRYPTTHPSEDFKAIAALGTRMRSYPLDVAFFLEHNPMRAEVERAARAPDVETQSFRTARTPQATQLQSSVREWEGTLNDLRDTANTAANDVAQPSFGGFTNHGVYTISPGDPKYATLLDGRPDGEPVTSARTYSTGTSTVVFVQESPTHMRIFSIDMNSDQIVKNVVYIGDKVLQAAVQSMIPVP